MAVVHLSPEVLEDFERFIDHLLAHGAPEPAGRVQQIIESIDVLRHSPTIGRPVGGGKRELVVARGAYVVLYRYLDPPVDAVFVLAARAGREGGYR